MPSRLRFAALLSSIAGIALLARDARAQSLCDPTQGATFTFSSTTQLSSLALKTLHRG